MNATNTMLLWNPRSGAVMLKPWPDTDRLHSDYRTGLACYAEVRKASFEQRKIMVLIEAMPLTRNAYTPFFWSWMNTAMPAQTICRGSTAMTKKAFTPGAAICPTCRKAYHRGATWPARTLWQSQCAGACARLYIE